MTLGSVNAVLGDPLELIRFARPARVADGFGSLDERGRLDASLPVETFITARMTHVFSVGAMLGVEGSRELAAHGIAALAGPLRDPEFDGWWVSLRDGDAYRRKQAYQLCFVVLASSSAATADIPGAARLLADALAVMDEHFWSDADGSLRESWDRRFTVAEDYWGANSNMHAVESLMAAHAATGDDALRDRALRIARTYVDGRARDAGWMLPEHFAGDWSPLPDYNIERPADEFRPYGVTIGHLLEWSRLLLELDSTFEAPEPWLREAADRLYDRAVDVGWSVDGADGFVYTVDRDGAPVVRQRPHWTVAEAIATAGTWLRLTGDARYRADLDRWEAYAAEHLVDREHGSWRHELDPSNRPAGSLWAGKPDVYHALHAVLIPGLPIAGSLTARLRLASGRTVRG